MASGIDGINGSGGINKPRPESVSGANDAARRTGAPQRAGDRIDLSPEAREAARLTDAAERLPDVRTDRIEALREALSAGTYRVDARQVAQAIVDFEGDLAG